MSDSKLARGKTAQGTDWHIHYTVHGSGPALILLHGGGPGATGHSNYNKNIAVLSQHYTTYVIDFPGWGRSSKNLRDFGGAGPFVNGGLALKAFMDAAGIDQAHLIGNSFGGGTALALALDHPERVGRLVMMGPGGGRPPGATGPTSGIVKLVTYYHGEGPTREKLKAFIDEMLYDSAQITPALLEERFQASLDPEIMANPPLGAPVGAPMKPPPFLCDDPRLAQLPHEVLMVWGWDDKVNPWEGALSFRAIPKFELHLLPQCGHWAQWEQAERFNSLVLTFLGRP